MMTQYPVHETKFLAKRWLLAAHKRLMYMRRCYQNPTCDPGSISPLRLSQTSCRVETAFWGRHCLKSGSTWAHSGRSPIKPDTEESKENDDCSGFGIFGVSTVLLFHWCGTGERCCSFGVEVIAEVFGFDCFTSLLLCCRCNLKSL